MELLINEQVGGASEPFIDEIGRCSRFCITLHRAPMPVECIYYGLAPLPPLSIEVLKIMKDAAHSEYVLCVPSIASALQSRIASAMVSLLFWMGQRSVLRMCGRTAERPQAPVSSLSHAHRPVPIG